MLSHSDLNIDTINMEYMPEEEVRKSVLPTKNTNQMAPSSPLRMKTSQHVRSFSLPSRTHPLLSQFNEHLSILGETEAKSISLSSLGYTLSGLQDLYVSVDDLIQMPHIQQSLTSVHETNKKLVNDDLLDTYIKILDACSATKDIFLQTKQDVQELLSSLRRRKDTSGIYLASRKKIKKGILKALKDLKNVKISEGSHSHHVEAISLFYNVQSVTVCVLESSLCYVMGTKTHSSLVSKIMHKKCKEASKNEFDQINEAFLGVEDTESIQRQLGKMELRIQDLEEGLDCLFKHVIRMRVSLLNMLTY